MIEDMQLRKLAPRTQACYIRVVKKLVDNLGHSPDSPAAEDLHQCQLHIDCFERGQLARTPPLRLSA